MVTGPTKEQGEVEVTPVHQSADRNISTVTTSHKENGPGLLYERELSTFSVGEDERFDEEELDEITELPSSPGREVKVNLPRTVDGFGLVIQGGRDRPFLGIDIGIFITEVKCGSVADRIGKLREGDKILEINGVPVIDVDHHEAVSLFKNSKKGVEMVVKKDAGFLLRAAAFTESCSPSPIEEQNCPTPEPPSETAVRYFSTGGFVIGIIMGCALVFGLKRYLTSGK